MKYFCLVTALCLYATAAIEVFSKEFISVSLCVCFLSHLNTWRVSMIHWEEYINEKR